MTTINNLLVSIDTVVPTLSIGQIQLYADRRSTNSVKLSDAERIRRAVLPASHWGELTGSLNGEKSQSLTDVLRGALVSIASDRLRDILTTDPMTRTVVLSDFTVSALLTWNSETAAGRGSITFTKDEVEDWFATSATRAALLTKWETAGKTALQVAALLTLVTQRFAALAARNHGLKEAADALKLTTLIETADLDGKDAALVTEIMGRLDHIVKSLAAKAATNSVSMDDL